MIINDDNYLLFTAHYYDLNQSAGTDEYIEDLKRLSNLRRIFKRYKDNGEINIRLALNHIVILYNCFGLKATEILFFKLKSYESCLIPFIMFLDYLPKYIYYENQKINTTMIEYDQHITNMLRKLGKT